MSGLHLVRIPINIPLLLRFGQTLGITGEDEGLGYTLHSWFSSLFGKEAPKPFRYFERRSEVLGYSRVDAPMLLDHAQSFAKPEAWAALEAAGVVSKPMPVTWRAGRRLWLEVLVCPVSRREGEEKDIYLRALDRLGEAAPTRAEVYQEWFKRQCEGAVQLERIELLGMTSRSRLLRRDRSNGNHLRLIERPQVLIGAEVTIGNPDRFVTLLERGVGRHRSFGFGMVLLSPLR